MDESSFVVNFKAAKVDRRFVIQVEETNALLALRALAHSRKSSQGIPAHIGASIADDNQFATPSQQFAHPEIIDVPSVGDVKRLVLIEVFLVEGFRKENE
jgi:hypothetical protein